MSVDLERQERSNSFGLPVTHRGIRQGVNKLGIYVMKIHYTADPEKRSQEWLEMAQEGIPMRDWNQEFEMVPVPTDGKPVYGEEYIPGKHELPAPHRFNPSWPTYYCWDFGYHRPCVSLFQEDPDERAIWFRCIMGEDKAIDRFVMEEIKPNLLDKYPTEKGNKIRHFCDPAGKQVRSTGKSDLDILNNDFKIYPTYSEDSGFKLVNAGVKLVRKLLTGRIVEHEPIRNWIPSIMIDPFNNPLATETMEMGYRYPEKQDDREEKQEPLKDGFYDNPADTLRYFSINRQVIHYRGASDRPRKKKKAYSPRVLAGGYRGY